MEVLARDFGNAYLFQQCVVFLMWLGLLKIALGELRAFRKEEARNEPLSVSRSQPEPLKALRDNTGGGRFVTASNAWRVESATPQRLRRSYGKKWSRVGVS